MPFEADPDVPGLIVKFGDYPLHHGGVGAIRSLGRLGVPMHMDVRPYRFPSRWELRMSCMK